MMRLTCGNLSEQSNEDANSRVKSDRGESWSIAWQVSTWRCVYLPLFVTCFQLGWMFDMMRLTCGNLSEQSNEDANSRVKSDHGESRSIAWQVSTWSVCIFAFVCDLLSAWMNIRDDEFNLWESL